MEEPRPLDSLFKEKIFRIPDYQRGYAWQHEQLKDFWEDLINLTEGRSHYVGVLTLKAVPNKSVQPDEKEYWLVDDHSYQLYHIVDGQQRLTTFVIVLQAFVDFIKALPENRDKSEDSIYITDSLSVAAVQDRFLFKVKPTGDHFRTYKFGYTEDNPSYDYLRHRILGEAGAGSLQETFYTLNLTNAKVYFSGQFSELYEKEGLEGIQAIYKTLVKRFLFNEYIIHDEFDVFVAFETMNNRGKKLSDLELLKNRLIYLTTLYSDDELDIASRTSLRDAINDAWKEIYHQLGRNKQKPLNDDDFLKAHWTMYFKYSRQKGNDYIRFLLDEQFSPKRVHKKVERQVVLEEIQEVSEQVDLDSDEENGNGADGEIAIVSRAELQPREIRDYVDSLKASVGHWFQSFYPALDDALTEKERLEIERLNRLGIVYFRPLVMALLKNFKNESDRVKAFQKIERFIFIVFRLTTARSNYHSSVYYNAAREIDQGMLNLDGLLKKLDDSVAFAFWEDGSFWEEDFHALLAKKFKAGNGYYGWAGLRYFLYEYELSLLEESRQQKVDWESLLKSGKDRISIEHIYPQTETDDWVDEFGDLSDEQKKQYGGSLGNFLLLSASINSSLQNDSFAKKKKPKFGKKGVKIRNGYSDGSHSEIEVSKSKKWTQKHIQKRGLKLLGFMEKRWGIEFGSEKVKKQLLFLNNKSGDTDEK